VIIVADGDNWNPERPTLTTSLRGLVDCVIEVRTLEHGVHSGMYGGVLPDALTVLVRLLGSMHDEHGRVAVAGLVSTASESEGPVPAEISQGRPLAGIELIGTGDVAQRMTHAPAISTVAIDAPSVVEAANQLVPTARAKVSLRLAPGDDPARAFAALEAHLRANVPWGASLEITPGACVAPFQVDPAGPAYTAAVDALEAAWNAQVVTTGSGVTIPFAGGLAAAYPRAAILVTGVADADCRAHGANEGLHLDLFRNACLAETFLLSLLDESRPPEPLAAGRGKERT
jgi:acetylornithine deacetylase/succinyl-diaminopimelate desuccinylase-like protein